METMKDKIFILKQNNLIKKMKENYFLRNLIMNSESIITYPSSYEIINTSFLPYKNTELPKENFELLEKNGILNFFSSEPNDITYVYFYGGIDKPAKIPIELFPLFIVKRKNIGHWLDLINEPEFYCLKFFNSKIDKVIDISFLDNEDDKLSIFIGIKA